MKVATVRTSDLISISEASSRGVSRLARDAEQGRELVLVRNNRPVAAVVGIKRLEEWEETEADLRDVALATARMLTAGDERHPLDDVLARFGYAREQLLALDR